MGHKGLQVVLQGWRNAKWILTAHLQKVHELLAEKGNHGCPSTCEGCPWCWNHLVMNARILNDSQSILCWNEWKAIVHAQIKTTFERDHLEEAAQGHEEVLNPPLVKLISKILLKILGIFNWGEGYIPWDAWIEKSEELGDTFQCKLFYVKKTKLAWNATLWKREFSKSTQLEEM
jgi:hypothetical protein